MAPVPVLVEEDLHGVVLLVDGVVVRPLLAFDPAGARVVPERSVTLAPARLASKVVDAALLLRVAEAILVPHGAARGPAALLCAASVRPAASS